MRSGEAFLDIVWRQFRKNRAAYWSLWLLAPIFLMAIFAPLIASNVPLVFHDGAQTIYPWLGPCSIRSENVDFAFNMALLGFVPWVVLALARTGTAGGGAGRAGARAGPGGRRVRWRIIAGAVPAVCRPAALRSAAENPDQDREFSRGAVSARAERSYGVYPPIPFGPTEIDLDARFKPPLVSQAGRIAGRKPTTVSSICWEPTRRAATCWCEMLYGTRISMTVGLVAVSIYLAIGIVLGALAGYFGGKIDMLISRVIEVVMLFPALFLILTLGGPDRPQHLHHHGRDRDHRLAEHCPAGPRRSAQAAGDRIHAGRPGARLVEPADRVSPHSAQCAVAGSGGGAVRHRQRDHHRGDAELAGLRRRAAQPSWGTLLQQGNDNYHYWWLIVVPSLGIFLTVTLFNLVGNGLRDAMDPKLRM